MKNDVKNFWYLINAHSKKSIFDDHTWLSVFKVRLKPILWAYILHIFADRKNHLNLVICSWWKIWPLLGAGSDSPLPTGYAVSKCDEIQFHAFQHITFEHIGIRVVYLVAWGSWHSPEAPGELVQTEQPKCRSNTPNGAASWQPLATQSDRAGALLGPGAPLGRRRQITEISETSPRKCRCYLQLGFRQIRWLIIWDS